jgi:DNA-binding Xre family transcriptional regulator
MRILSHEMAAASARRVPAERPSPAAKVERMKQRLRENVGKNLLRIRTERELTQRQLSERADISQTWISQLETNKGSAGTNLGLNLIAALAVALDVNPVDLICD